MWTKHEGDSLTIRIPVTGPDGAAYDLDAAGASLDVRVVPRDTAQPVVTASIVPTGASSERLAVFSAGTLPVDQSDVEIVLAAPGGARHSRRHALRVIPALRPA